MNWQHTDATIEVFMDFPKKASFVSTIIEKNKDTISENLQREDIGSLDFGWMPPSNTIIDPNHPCFRRATSWEPIDLE